MCTYATVTAPMTGSAKGPNSSWFKVTDATVYFDHPVHALAEHTLNIDLAAPAKGPSARVAVELTAESARELMAAIQAALDSAPAEMTAR
jgi:Family of unknown function (DUF6295)